MDAELIDADESGTMDPRLAALLEESAACPVDALPACVADLVRSHCTLTGLPPRAIAPMLLACCAGVIGNLARLHLPGGWSEACALWSILVADSGTMKSASVQVAQEILKAVQDAETDPGTESAKQPRLLVGGDPTTEALAMREQCSPRGLAYVRDEVVGLFQGMDRYRSRPGPDRSYWLEAYDGNYYEQARKKSESALVHHHLISVAGAIQPLIARAALLGDPAKVASGLIPRFNFTYLERRRWQPRMQESGEERDAAMRRLVERLCRIRTMPLQASIHPHAVRARPEAAHVLQEYGEQQSSRAHLRDADLAASMLNKSRGVAARIALIFAVLEHATADAAPEDLLRPVTEDQARRACEWAEWMAGENLRTYRVLSVEEHGPSRTRAIELAAESWKRNGGMPFTSRDFQRTHGVKRAQADELLKHCQPEWESVAAPQNPKGGRPVIRWQPRGWRPGA